MRALGIPSADCDCAILATLLALIPLATPPDPRWGSLGFGAKKKERWKPVEPIKKQRWRFWLLCVSIHHFISWFCQLSFQSSFSRFSWDFFLSFSCVLSSFSWYFLDFFFWIFFCCLFCLFGVELCCLITFIRQDFAVRSWVDSWSLFSRFSLSHEFEHVQSGRLAFRFKIINKSAAALIPSDYDKIIRCIYIYK